MDIESVTLPITIAVTNHTFIKILSEIRRLPKLHNSIYFLKFL